MTQPIDRILALQRGGIPDLRMVCHNGSYVPPEVPRPSLWSRIRYAVTPAAWNTARLMRDPEDWAERRARSVLRWERFKRASLLASPLKRLEFRRRARLANAGRIPAVTSSVRAMVGRPFWGQIDGE